MQHEVRLMEEENRQTRVVGMRQQGKWLNWEDVGQRYVKWKDMWKMDSQRIAFLLRSTYDLLPSPTNLHLWGKEENPFCKLCGKPANLEHILSSCQRALTEGRYRWRHDRVLRVMAREMEKEVKKSRPGQKKVVFIPFVRSGEAAKQKAERAGLLHSSPQWKMEVDLDKRLVFPMQIVTTRLRPDIIIWSESEIVEGEIFDSLFPQ